ncbi:glucoamylase family protein [Pedobacter sandarakinus]|uniref:glucoamylase family protein n=1 Tax=Pedobacter sandarakinus TaxID=353156 RepID=UPI002245B0A7|nr:glucoamylase family protein [Pedobacter sandarakinus]MCX2572969.1 beta-glucosidase [Pedobacter sandarakinus]
MKNNFRNLLFLSLIAIASTSCAQKPYESYRPDLTIKKNLSDEQLLDLVQKQTFQYFWDGAEPVSGAGRERYHVDGMYPQNDKNTVATGATGFGLMAILSGIDRGYVSKKEGLDRLNQIMDFLAKADRFHGAWSHWIDGETGKVKPFGKKDNGGDLVETSFVAQGLICINAYYKNGNAAEQALAKKADDLWKGIDFNWYRNGGQDVLYWHWSPEYQWQMNFPVKGYNECLIMYVLAASSPTHTVPATVYHKGWARDGAIRKEFTFYNHKFTLDYQGQKNSVGPLFWAHYSYLGLNPKGLKDQYADYWENNVNHTLAIHDYCVANPKKFKGYAENSWGLTASYSVKGYAAHNPQEDFGVISPTAAISSIPYTPKESMRVIRHLYEDLGDRVWGKYGFYDAFSETDNWYPKRYLGIDQGPMAVMIENHRSGLLWKLFMSNTDVKNGLKKLGFESPEIKK